MMFSELGLRAELLRAVAEEGYSTPTPIQAQAIPVVLEGKNLLAGAQTGTGKTAGFTLPLLQRLMVAHTGESGRRPVRALILVPTRELAAQVADSVRTYGKYLPLRATVIFGGVGFEPQVQELRRGVDIVIATPGRLLDHMHQRTISLSQVQTLVLDEADRMLDMGFIHDIRRVLAVLPTERQNLLFSATFSDDIRKLADSFLKSPVSIEVARRNAPAEAVAQVVHPVDGGRKRELLSHLVSSGNWSQVLVFTRTKHGADRLTKQLLRDNIESAAIHGNKSQNARTRVLKDFKTGSLRVLVATDIAARGLDIEELPHVVNFDLPNVPEDYVHRIGRTGRAGADGTAVSLVSYEEMPLLRDIERLIKRTLDRQVIAGYEPTGARTPASEDDDRREGQRPGGRGRPSGRPPQRTQGGDSRRGPGPGARPGGRPGQRPQGGGSSGSGGRSSGRSGPGGPRPSAGGSSPPGERLDRMMAFVQRSRDPN